MVVNFCGNQIFMDFIRFLINKVSYAWCLRYICSAWFLDIRISTCSSYSTARCKQCYVYEIILEIIDSQKNFKLLFLVYAVIGKH